MVEQNEWVLVSFFESRKKKILRCFCSILVRRQVRCVRHTVHDQPWWAASLRLWHGASILSCCGSLILAGPGYDASLLNKSGLDSRVFCLLRRFYLRFCCAFSHNSSEASKYHISGQLSFLFWYVLIRTCVFWKSFSCYCLKNEHSCWMWPEENREGNYCVTVPFFCPFLSTFLEYFSLIYKFIAETYG